MQIYEKNVIFLLRKPKKYVSLCVLIFNPFLKKMKVVLAEKPSVGRSIANVIGATSPKDGYMEGNGYQVTWAYGHLVKLADPDEYISSEDKTWKSEDLPILPNNFKYIPDTGEAAKRKQFNCIKKLFADADEIICATDAGREGEAIFRYIYDACRCTKPIKRLWISSLTDSAITKGFNSLQDGDEFLNLYASAMARAEADWLIGMNATRALTIASKSKNAISVGRVQSPTLAMICSRFFENQNFKPTPYYVVRLNLCEKGYTKQSFWANFAKKFNTKEDATKILQNISNEIIVSDVQMTTVTERAPLPFDLTSIQAEANKRFKFKAQKTLDIIQKLYEEKLVTYPRTGSRYLGTDMINEISSNLPKLINNSHVNISDAVKFIEKNGMNKTPFNDKKLTDHHAIIPTFEPLTKISDDEMKIYQMISDQLVMSLMPDCIKRKITYSFGNEEPIFTASGTQIEKIGWRDFPGKRQEKNEDEEDNQSVPELKKGNTCSVLDKVVSEKMTVRPPLLTEATLLKKMETAGKEIEDEQLSKAIKDCGLGTPATRAAVIETLYKREYITNDKNHLLPTDKGLKVYEIISQYPIADVETTGSWEFDLNKIADGELQKEDFDNKIKSYAKEITSSLLNVNITITSTKQSVGICPVCGKEVFEGKNSYYCSGINKDDENSCKFGFGKEIASKTISLANAKALLSEKKTGLIKGFKSNAGKSFDAMLVLDENNKVNFQFENKKK